MKVNIDLDSIILCPECDLILSQGTASPGEKLVCPRCAALLDAPRKNPAEKTMALSLAGIFLYFPANFLPLLTFDAAGLKSSGSIADSCMALLNSGFLFTGGMVLLTSILIPLVKLLMLFIVATSIHIGSSTRHTATIFRYYHHLDEWGMLEVYMIGILVTIIKMLHMAHVEYDVGFFCFIGLLAATLGSSAAMDSNFFWRQIEIQATRHNKRHGIETDMLEVVPAAPGGKKST